MAFGSTPLTPPLTPDPLKTATSFKSFSKTREDLPTPPYTPEWRNSRSSIASSNRLSIDSSFFLEHAQSSRALTQNELSYYLPGRADGVNDMYLHHRLSAPADLMSPSRLLHVWALQMLRHPLLATRIQSTTYTDTSFTYIPPSTLVSALTSAQTHFSYSRTAHDMINTYLNGSRTLSNDRLAMLQIKHLAESQDYEIMLCATHFLGDGMALHTFMNEFYTILGDASNTVTNLSTLIEAELEQPHTLPLGLEDRLPQTTSRFVDAVGADEYKRNEAKLIGGQSFPGNSRKSERKTVVPTFAYSDAETKAILASCKKNGVTIAHAMFALCNIAWARRTGDKIDPCLIYSALNLRPNMLPPPADASPSFFHLAVGYFNIVLPSLLPADLTPSELFWHRARSTKSQTIKAVKSPFVVSRSREASKVRSGRAVKWAAVDDAEEAAKGNTNAGLGLSLEMPKRQAPASTGTTTTTSTTTEPKIAPVRAFETTPATPTPAADHKVSQRALMGVSMLGNLDGMYKHAAFGDITLQGLTTGSRQRPGGLLLFAYTFTGKLWLSLGYDVNGFAPGSIEGFWEEVQCLVREILL